MTHVKEHVEKHKTLYFCGVTTLVVAGITTLIMRDRYETLATGGVYGSKTEKNSITMRSPRDHVSETYIQGGISVRGKSNSLNMVSYFDSNRQGPPSWVVRCLETGALFTSQKSAALEMDLLPSELSKHLNGLMENVRGFTFERICMAA